jgi:hypothetical protein
VLDFVAMVGDIAHYAARIAAPKTQPCLSSE